MKGIKCITIKGFFPALLLGLLLTSLLGQLLPLSQVANAVSVYDGIPLLRSDAVLFNSANTISYDFKLNWYTEALSVLNQRCTSFGGASCTNRDSFQNNIGDPTKNWSVGVASDGDPAHPHYLNIAFDTVTGGYADFSLSGGIPTFFQRSGSGSNIHTVQFYLNTSGSGIISTNQLGFLQYTTNNTAIPYQDSTYDTELLFSTFPVTTPAGYAGTIPPATVTTPEDKYQRAQIEIIDKDVTIIPDKVPFPVLVNPEYRLKYQLQAIDPLNEFDESQIIGRNDDAQFTVQTYGNYQLDISYWHITLDEVLPNTDDFTYELSAQMLLEIDGTIQSYHTDEYICNALGVCAPYEETWIAATCSITQLDGCLSNAWHYISEWLGISKNKQNPTGSPFVNFQTQTHGLTSVITAPIFILSNLSDGSYTCANINIPLPFVGSNITLPCMTPIYTSMFGSLFVLYQTIIGGIISYYVIVKLLETAKDIKDPKKDQIEVTKL